MWDMIVGKLRPNALLIALGCLALVGVFGWQLYSFVDSVLEADEVTDGMVGVILGLAALTFTPLGALVTLAGQMATDAPPPAVPATTVEKLGDRFLDILERAGGRP